MGVSKKTSRSTEDSETTVVSETVILGAERNNMPAALAVDEDGILDIEKLSTEKDSEQDKENESQRGKVANFKRHVIGRLLKLARQPENLLVQAYYESKIRNKLSNFEWYQKFEGDQQLNNKLENIYGGTNSPANNLIYFVKNNILVSLIVICLSLQLFTSYLSHSAENYRYAEQEQISIAPLQAPEVTIEPDYSNVLNHCAVTDSLREFYSDTENLSLKNKVATEVEGFINVYSNSDVEQWYADQQNKLDSAIAQVQSILPRTYKYRDQIAAEISTVTQQYGNLKSTLHAINNSSSRSLKNINNSIKVRSQLTDLQARMTTGPSLDTLTELDTQLHRLNAIFSGDSSASTSVSGWALKTSKQDQTALVSSIRDIISKDVDANIEYGSQGTPGAKLYRLQIVVATLSHFGDLIEQLKNSPNYFEVQVDNKQNSINRKIRELLGLQEAPLDARFLDYDNCLTALNTASTKLTIY